MTKYVLLLGMSLLAACAGQQSARPTAEGSASTSGPSVPAAKPALGSFGFAAEGMDRSIAPGDSFSGYANGTWERTTQIPADRPSWGSFPILSDLSEARTRSIIEGAAAAQATPGSNLQKVGDYFASFMDEATIEAKGLTPLKPLMDRIGAISTRRDLARALGEANRDGVTTPFTAVVQQDLKANDQYAFYLVQGGLGLPDRDYYLDTKNPKLADARTQYRKYIVDTLRQAGFDNPEQRAARIYDLEHKIAEAHWSRVETRQIEKLYNKMARGDLGKQMPGVDWPALLEGAGGASQPSVVIGMPSAFAGAAKLVAGEPLQTWKDYLAFHTIRNAAPALPAAYVRANFDLYGKSLAGTPELKARWKRGVELVNGGLGEAVGQLYVQKYFPPEAKAKADALVRNLIVAMDERLSNLAWMAPETKQKARAKLAGFTPKIGYPDKWRDYSALVIDRGDALGNVLRAQRFEYDRKLAKLGQPIDRSEWAMTPQTVNAYANPLLNEVVFPAAILQPPFFDPNADPAVNYGGIGAVIGHEITHHFDDQGRKFDAAGNLADWWTPQDVERFNALTKQVVAQYSQYEPLPGMHVNGELTLGENMADLAGINIAYDAYRKSLGGKDAPVIDGFTGDQRFFLGWAQVWRTKYRDALLQQALMTDVHTPGHFRPMVVRNLDPWYAAFGVKPGQELYLSPEQRIRIW